VIIERLGSDDFAFVDHAGVIEREYRDLVDGDWFEAWFGDRLAVGDISIVRAEACPELIRFLVVTHGFPRAAAMIGTTLR